MYIIKVKSEFSGAHNLRGYDGKCENLHGHNWKVEVEAASEELDEQGMVLDFKKAKKELLNILNQLDHKYLNDIHGFKEHNPTSENIAKFLYDSLNGKINKLVKITVWETDTSSASYSR